MLTSIRGIYRKGQIEFREKPQNIEDETRVIVTFVTPDVNLRERGIGEKQAQLLREQLSAFAEDWDSPEMSIYDDYDAHI